MQPLRCGFEPGLALVVSTKEAPHGKEGTASQQIREALCDLIEGWPEFGRCAHGADQAVGVVDPRGGPGGREPGRFRRPCLPRGTHDWRKFLRPSELTGALRDHGLEVGELTGVVYNPLTASWRSRRNLRRGSRMESQ